MSGRAQVGEIVEIRSMAKVVQVSDSHGLSYKVVLPKGDYLYPRQIWLEASECRVVTDVRESATSTVAEEIERDTKLGLWNKPTADDTSRTE